MADITSQFAFSDKPRSGFQRALASVRRGFNAVSEAHSRRIEIEALEAKSDSELAALGLSRNDIVRHVFRDKLYL